MGVGCPEMDIGAFCNESWGMGFMGIRRKSDSVGMDSP